MFIAQAFKYKHDWWRYLLPALGLLGLFGLCLVGFFQYRFNTNAKTAKRMETYAGLYIIAFDLILAFELIRSHGVELSWS